MSHSNNYNTVWISGERGCAEMWTEAGDHSHLQSVFSDIHFCQSLSHINKTFTTQTKDIKCLTMGGESANILAPWYHFLKEPLNNFSDPSLYSSSSEQMPSHCALCYCLIFWNFLSSDQTTCWKTQCSKKGERRGVSAELSWPADAAKHSNSVTRRQHSWDYLRSCMHTFTSAHIHAP